MVPTDASEAKEYQYEEQRDHELQESINGGQSGWALYLISEGGNPKKVLNDNRPKRQETKPVPVPVAEPAQEPSNLPESYAGRFTGSAIALANKLAGAQKQAIAGEGEVSYGRKKRHDTGVPHSHPHPEPVSAPEPAKEPSNLPESYAGRFTGSAIALANKLAGAMRQAIAGEGEVSYGRKKRQTAFAGEIIRQYNINILFSYNSQKCFLKVAEQFVNNDAPRAGKSTQLADRLSGSSIAIANQLAGAEKQAVVRGEASYGRKKRSDTEEQPSEELPKDLKESMNDQLEDIEKIQSLWLDFLQHGISSRRKRQSVKVAMEKALDKEVVAKGNLPESMADQMTEIQNVQELWLEFLQHGISSRRRRQTVEQALEDARLDESILQEIFPTPDELNELDQLSLINEGSLGAITGELRIKSWGETGHNVPSLS